MPTVLEIYNRALTAMGSRNTVGSTSESSAEATALNSIYDGTRDELLELALWSFARRASALAIDKAAFGVTGATATTSVWDATWPAPPWNYQYEVPADFIRARYIVPKASVSATSLTPQPSHDVYYAINPPYEFIVGSDVNGVTPVKVILTDVHLPVLIYTAQITDPNGWTPLFTQALVLLLATRVALPLAGDGEVLKLNLQQALTLIAQAQVSNFNQGITPNISMPDWIRGRGIDDPRSGFMP